MKKSILTLLILVMTILVGCAGTGGAATPTPAESAIATLTGTVTYLQRIALPEGAIVTVQLVDVSLADAPATVLAEQTITTTTQVPIPFTLEFNPADIQPNHTYAVQARIEVDGQLQWITTTQYPVLTNGAPSENIEIIVDQA